MRIVGFEFQGKKKMYKRPVEVFELRNCLREDMQSEVLAIRDENNAWVDAGCAERGIRVEMLTLH